MRPEEIKNSMYNNRTMALPFTKNLLALKQLSNSFTQAVHRSDTADFLFVLIFKGQGQSIYFAVPIWGGVPVTARPGDPACVGFESTVPHLFQLSIKHTRLMKRLDLSAYLVDILIHSQKISDWHNRPQETEQHLAAIETWWDRHIQTGSILYTGVAYMMIAHLNMLKGYVYLMDAGEDWRSFNTRIFKIKAEIIEELGHANFLWEKGEMPSEPQQ